MTSVMRNKTKTLATETRKTIEATLKDPDYIERIKEKFDAAGFKVVENSWGLIEAGEGKKTTNFHARKKGTMPWHVTAIKNSIEQNGFNLRGTHPVPYAKVQWNDGSVTKEPVQVDNRHQKTATDSLNIPNAKIEIQNKDGSPLSEIEYKLLGTKANGMHNPSESASMEDWVSQIREQHEIEPMWSDKESTPIRVNAAKNFLIRNRVAMDSHMLGVIAKTAVAQDYSNPLFKVGENLPTAKEYEDGVNKNDPGKDWVAFSITGTTRVAEVAKHIVNNYRKKDDQRSHILLYVSNLNCAVGRAKKEAKEGIRKFIIAVQSELDFWYTDGIDGDGKDKTKVDRLASFFAIPQVQGEHKHYWEDDKFGVVPISQY
jgi:hypothetical protein